MKCPRFPWKTRHPTRNGARLAAFAALASQDGPENMTVYGPCDACDGGFHLSSQAPYKPEAKR
jgi:hypothetical protein